MMVLPEGVAITLLLCVLMPLLFRPALAQSILEDLVRQSTFIFEGTITKLQAATMPIVSVSDNTIVVKVERIYHAPKLLGDRTSKEVTVLVKDPTGLQVGEQALFFAQGWLLGEGVAVQEMGRLKKGILVNPGEHIAAAGQSIADQNLQRRIASADVVVMGKVSETKLRAEPDRPRPITEHDPQWQEAILEVEAVFKGDASLKRIVVLFPGTLDVAWVNVPKFKVGQEAIWILHRDPTLQAYTALDPLDFQPKNQLDRVRDLIK